VPDVRGLPVDQAEQELTQAGYAWHVTQQPDPNVTPGNVIQQSPNHDSTAKIGSTVELYVATAPPPSAPPTTTPPSSPSPTASSPSPPASTPAKK
jgi:eukaryotic-like serine/threonine-protein kinase